ncbi:MAG: hypothetical protein CMM50_10470 [Rhodospirillaceae bacterium]|nr:hypothetical protein [Rhodospirillaceae bacterium]
MWPYSEYEARWLLPHETGYSPEHQAETDRLVALYVARGRRLQAEAVADAIRSGYRMVKYGLPNLAHRVVNWTYGSQWRRYG